jgi:NADH-quinone oxidoreductase subunit A
MHLQLAYVLLFFLLGAGITGAILTLSSLVRPRRPSREKLTTYECAEVPIGSGWFRLNLRFYTVALIFIIFDVELIAVLPVALVYREWVSHRGLGLQAFFEIFLFVGILLIGLIYVWQKGDLEWFKRIEKDEKPARITSFNRRTIDAGEGPAANVTLEARS